MNLFVNGVVNSELVEVLAKALFVRYCKGEKGNLTFTKGYGDIAFCDSVRKSLRQNEEENTIALHDDYAEVYFRFYRNGSADKAWFRKLYKTIEESLPFIETECPSLHPVVWDYASRFGLI